MQFHTRVTLIPLLVAAVSLAACGPEGQKTAEAAPSADTAAAPASPPPAAPAKREAAKPAAKPAVAQGELGTIAAVVPVHATAPTTGAGAVLGGVLGAAIGNQVGGGDGRKVATVLGAAGGAVVGNNVEKSRNTHIVGYRVDVRLDSGQTKSLHLPQAPAYATGQRVRLLNGVLQAV